MFSHSDDEKEKKQNHFLKLPQEATLAIFKLLGVKDLSAVLQADKSMHELAQDEFLWRDLCLEEFSQLAISRVKEADNMASWQAIYHKLTDFTKAMQRNCALVLPKLNEETRHDFLFEQKNVFDMYDLPSGVAIKPDDISHEAKMLGAAMAGNMGSLRRLFREKKPTLKLVFCENHWDALGQDLALYKRNLPNFERFATRRWISDFYSSDTYLYRNNIVDFIALHGEQSLLNEIFAIVLQEAAVVDHLKWAVICNQSEKVIDKLINDCPQALINETASRLPIAYAIYLKNIETVSLLLKRTIEKAGPVVNIIEEVAYTAALRGQCDVLSVLNSPLSLLYIAIIKDEKETVISSYEKLDLYSRSLVLDVICMHGKHELLRALFSSNPDIGKDISGKMFELAVLNGHKELAHLLIEISADQDFREEEPSYLVLIKYALNYNDFAWLKVAIERRMDLLWPIKNIYEDLDGCYSLGRIKTINCEIRIQLAILKLGSSLKNSKKLLQRAYNLDPEFFIKRTNEIKAEITHKDVIEKLTVMTQEIMETVSVLEWPSHSV